jgi:hypothetical protein
MTLRIYSMKARWCIEDYAGESRNLKYILFERRKIYIMRIWSSIFYIHEKYANFITIGS